MTLATEKYSLTASELELLLRFDAKRSMKPLSESDYVSVTSLIRMGLLAQDLRVFITPLGISVANSLRDAALTGTPRKQRAVTRRHATGWPQVVWANLKARHLRQER